MLEDVLRYCNRLQSDDEFVKSSSLGTHTIEGGSIAPSISIGGLYYCIWGSDYNDGVHASDEELIDETFYGSVWLLRLPKAFLDLVSEMAEWQEKNGATVSGPYISESFGGYSYSKATDAKTGGTATAWSTFAGRLSQWRKI